MKDAGGSSQGFKSEEVIKSTLDSARAKDSWRALKINIGDRREGGVGFVSHSVAHCDDNALSQMAKAITAMIPS